MPRTLGQGVAFVVGLWAILTLLGPLYAPRAAANAGELSHLEVDLHEAVNAFRRDLRLIPLERRAELDAVARAHSADMVVRGYFSHETPEGLHWVDRLERAGVTGFALAGENVGQTNRPEPNREILHGWQHSPAHRENLTARPYNATGIGIVRAPDGRLFYTQLYLTFPR